MFAPPPFGVNRLAAGLFCAQWIILQNIKSLINMPCKYPLLELSLPPNKRDISEILFHACKKRSRRNAQQRSRRLTDRRKSGRLTSLNKQSGAIPTEGRNECSVELACQPSCLPFCCPPGNIINEGKVYGAWIVIYLVSFYNK